MFFITFCFIHCGGFFFSFLSFYIHNNVIEFFFFFFHNICSFAFTMVFNKLWVMERSPHIVECRRMLNAAVAPIATTRVLCVVVYRCLYLHFIIVYSVIESHTTTFACSTRARLDFFFSFFFFRFRFLMSP